MSVVDKPLRYGTLLQQPQMTKAHASACELSPPTPPRGHWKDTWKLEWHLKGVSPMNSQSEHFEEINSYSDVSILVYLSLKDSLISVVTTHK